MNNKHLLKRLKINFFSFLSSHKKKGLLIMFISVFFSVIADSSVNYKWEEIISYPNNKYYINTFDTQEDEPAMEGGAKAPFPALGDESLYPAQIIKNFEYEEGKRVLRIFFTQFSRSAPYKGSSSWYPHFMLSKNSNDYCYPVDFSDLNLGDNVHAIIPQSGKMYKLASTPLSIISGSGDYWLHINHFLIEDPMYDLTITIYFDAADDNYEKPLSIKFDYKNNAPLEKAFFIGSLSKTSELYDESQDKLGGYMTRVPFETNEYPLTYTFKATQKEYEFIVFHKFPYWISKGPDDYQVFLRAYDYDNYRFHNEMGSGLEPLVNRIANDLEMGIINSYTGFYGLPHNDNELGKNYKNSINYTPFHLKDLEIGKIYQIKFDEPVLTYVNQPTYDWVLNSELDEYFREKGIDISNLKEYYSLFDIDVVLPDEEPQSKDNLNGDLSKNPRELTEEEIAKVNRVPVAKRPENDVRYQVLKGVSNEISSTHINLLYTEYTPDPKAYQLVQALSYNDKNILEPQKDNNGNLIFYTYDFNKSGSITYKVCLDSSNKVVSYDEVKTINGKTIDENSIYIPETYQFTDMLFITSNAPEWMESPYVNNKITGIRGKIKYNNSAEVLEFNTEDSFDPANIHEIVKLNGVDSPIDQKDFAINYSYQYSNRYQVAHRSMLDITKPATVDINYLILKDVNIYYNGELEKDFSSNEYKLKMLHRSDDILLKVMPELSQNLPPSLAAKWVSSKGEYVGDEIELQNPQINTNGVLTIPEPLKVEPVYSLSTDKIVSGGEDNKVNIRLYAEDLKPSGQNYLQMEYKLPDLNLHQHDYNVTFGYEGSNVTYDLGSVMISENKPVFNFHIQGYEDIALNPNTNDTPGFFNADLGEIYEIDQNLGQQAIRTLTMSTTPADFTNIYRRWGSGTSAVVDLDLEAPKINDNLGLTDVSLNVHHAARAAEGENMVEEYLFISGVDIVNTLDEIKTDGLVTGDNNKDYTTLYLLELLDLETGEVKENGRILATKEEISKMEFDLYVSESMDYDRWAEEYHSKNGRYLIDVDNLKVTAKPFRLRNVYLFPIANEGLLKSSQVFIRPQIALYADGDNQSSLPYYHGVTTPYVEPEYDLELLNRDNIITGIEGVNDGLVSDSNLVRVSAGSVEILLDGVDLYGADGILVGNGKGVYKASHGVYIARKGNRIQKVFVK